MVRSSLPPTCPLGSSEYVSFFRYLTVFFFLFRFSSGFLLFISLSHLMRIVFLLLDSLPFNWLEILFDFLDSHLDRATHWTRSGRNWRCFWKCRRWNYGDHLRAHKSFCTSRRLWINLRVRMNLLSCCLFFGHVSPRTILFLFPLSPTCLYCYKVIMTWTMTKEASRCEISISFYTEDFEFKVCLILLVESNIWATWIVHASLFSRFWIFDSYDSGFIVIDHMSDFGAATAMLANLYKEGKMKSKIHGVSLLPSLLFSFIPLCLPLWSCIFCKVLFLPISFVSLISISISLF